jgi:hypothetical protein
VSIQKPLYPNGIPAARSGSGGGWLPLPIAF